MSLNIDKKTVLGKGATASIYKASLDGVSFAAKIYNETTGINKAKINAMLSNAPNQLKLDSNGAEAPLLAWPIKIIESDTGSAIGYLMPLIDLNNSFPLDYYYDKVLFEKLNAPDEAALSYKLEVAKNLADVVSYLHANGHYFIDLKPQNIRVFKKSHIVTLLDCDGFSIFSKNGVRYPAELISTDYISPEATKENTPPKDLGENQDKYALAVILFQLLNNGTHPFQGIINSDTITANTNDEKAAAGLYPHGLNVNDKISPRPQSTHHLWPNSTRLLFDRAFIGEPDSRPSAKEWYEHFNELLIKKALVRCDQQPSKVAHMRFKNKPCPACYLEKIPKFTRPQGTRKPRVTKTVAQQSNSDTQLIVWGFIIFIILVLFVSCMSNKTEAPAPAYEPAPAVDVTPQPSAPLVDSNPVLPYAYDPALSANAQSPKTAEVNPAPHGYVAIYLGDSYGFWWAAGYQSEKEAKASAKKGCKKYYGSCKQHISGAYRCLAIAEGISNARGWAMADSKTDAENQAISQCQSGGDVCSIPNQGSGCSSW